MTLFDIVLNLIVLAVVFAYLPERLFRFLFFVFAGRRPGAAVTFLRDNLIGLILGICVSTACLIALGSTPENLVWAGVRNAVDLGRRFLGFDPVDRCVDGLRAEYRWTNEEFAQEAARFNMMQVYTLTDRQSLLAAGNIALMFGHHRAAGLPVYEFVLRKHCEEKSVSGQREADR